MRNIILAVSVSCLILSAVHASRAQDDTPPAVARLSVIEGEGSLLRGDDPTSWISATVNTPLVPGDSVLSGPNSRAEIQLDHNNVLRLAERTQVRIASLTEDQIQIEVSQGLMNFAVLQDAGFGEGASLQPFVEIDTPNVAVRPLLPGVYRIRVDSDAQVEITVRKGRAEVFASGGSTTVEQDKTLTARGTNAPEYRLAPADSVDDWDTWNTERDRTILAAQSWEYTNPYYTGANDLDQYGDWMEVPGYNWCWTPRVDVGWVPYADGRWLWELFWGWTWVSSEHWGWAPYHYGRWFWYENRWVWWPGQLGTQSPPAYAPAYVAFLGFGFGGHNYASGYGYGYQQLGWVPVGPSDGYYPWSGHQNTYQAVGLGGSTGVMHIRRAYEATTRSGPAAIPPLATAQQPVHSNLQDVLSNPQARHSVVTVSTESFIKGQIASHPQAIDLSTLNQYQLLRGTLPVVPTRESLRPADRPASRAVPTAPITTQRFFDKLPAAPKPRPFDETAAEIRQMISQPYPPSENRKAPQQFVKQRSETPGQNRALRGAVPAAPAQALPEGRAVTTREFPPANPADTQASESASSPDSLSTPDEGEPGTAGNNQQTGPAQGSQSAGNRFPPHSTGGTLHRRPAPPDQTMRDRSPGSKADAQPRKPDLEAPRTVPVPSASGEGALAHDEAAAKPSRDDSVARRVRDAGGFGGNRPKDETAPASVKTEPRTEIARPTPAEIRSEAPEVRNAAPAPRDAPRDSSNRKN
jgi:hypothetical protein